MKTVQEVSNLTGVRNMDFSVFDATKIDEYSEQVKAMWGKTPQYQEFEQKTKGLSADEKNSIGDGLMVVIAEFGVLRDLQVSDERVQAQVKKLQMYINEHFYQCSNEMLGYLSKMYIGGGSITENINAAGGEGCADFIHDAIQMYIQ